MNNRWALAGLCLGLALLGGIVGRGDDSPRSGRQPRQRGDSVSSGDEDRGGAGAIVLKPARVFDGVAVRPHPDWVVVVRGQRIEAAGPKDKVKAPDGAR